MVAARVLLLLCGLATQARAARNTIIYPDEKPISVPLMKEQNIAFGMPETLDLVSDRVVSLKPEQVHLTYWGSPSKMLVSFASGDGRVTMGPPPAPGPPGSVAVAQWGQAPGKLSGNASCDTVTYVQNQFAWEQFPGYVSPRLSHCLMTGLPPGSRVFYRVGWPEYDQWSAVMNFTTTRATANFPFSLGVMADLGTSFNASQTVRQMARLAPSMVLNVGDLAYADTYLPDGRQGIVRKYYYSINYQPRWDMYGRMLQGLASHIPVLPTPGNHDMEFQPDGTVFAAYTSRYPVPQAPAGTKPGDAPLRVEVNRFTAANPSPDRGLFYSVDIPGTAHISTVTSYITNDTFQPDTDQYKWFEADLAGVDRKKTPWLIVMFHAPVISSYEDAFKQVECMRLTYEPLLYKYGVDIVYNGHVHAYERSKPQYNYTLDPCGTIHITAGCGGKAGIPVTGEYALDRGFIDDQPQPEYCADPEILSNKINPTQPGPRCFTRQKALGGYCWDRQPDFSAYRQPAYGHGLLNLINATHAEWNWYLNADHGERVVDRVVINRALPKRCRTRR
ncbi:MAG: Metallo-dependent phosphatase-like protein [Monoraphidium minutum]|nr:MAG: Metallo-dependent phosphatase-like protein [Monoraphidium minutum]